MGRYFYVLLLLIAAGALRPMPAFAQECFMDKRDGSGRIDYGIWRYTLRDSLPVSGKAGTMKAMFQPAGQVPAGARHVRLEKARDPKNASVSIGVSTALGHERESGHRTDDFWLESASATPALFRSLKPGRPTGKAESVVADSAEWIRTAEKSGTPEPGGWAMLMAGVLGVCAVARRRMVSI